MMAAWMASKFAPWLAGLALLAAAAGAFMAYHHAGVNEGVARESLRRDAIDAKNSAAANARLVVETDRVRAAQADLATAQADNQRLQLENEHAKTTASHRNAALLSGDERLRIEVTGPRDPVDAASAGGPAAAAVDQGTGAYADIAPTVAAGLDAIREAHNEAVRRLDACIREYDALHDAVNAP